MKKCLTCERELKPGTHVPRLSETASESMRQYVETQVAARKQELEEGRVGYLGESQFCNQQCAAFFGRTCVSLLNYVEFFPSPGVERLAMATKLASRIFEWVKKRKEGR